MFLAIFRLRVLMEGFVCLVGNHVANVLKLVLQNAMRRVVSLARLIEKEMDNVTYVLELAAVRAILTTLVPAKSVCIKVTIKLDLTSNMNASNAAKIVCLADKITVMNVKNPLMQTGEINALGLSKTA